MRYYRALISILIQAADDKPLEIDRVVSSDALFLRQLQPDWKS